MEFDKRDHFEEKAEDDVNGFTIIDTNEELETYQVAEKWLKEDGGSWIQYNIPAEKLQGRISDEECERVGQVTDEQFDAILDNVGMELEA
jgi:hypothetical protein